MSSLSLWKIGSVFHKFNATDEHHLSNLHFQGLEVARLHLDVATALLKDPQVAIRYEKRWCEEQTDEKRKDTMLKALSYTSETIVGRGPYFRR